MFARRPRRPDLLAAMIAAAVAVLSVAHVVPAAPAGDEFRPPPLVEDAGESESAGGKSEDARKTPAKAGRPGEPNGSAGRAATPGAPPPPPPADSASTTRSASREEGKHPDGSLRYRVRLNAKGEWHGTYQGYHPGGKKLRERAEYDKGQRHGVRSLYDERKQRVAEEAWVRGRLVFPKSPRIIDAERERIAAATAASVAKFGTPRHPNAPGREALARALARVNVYRYLCGVPHDVALDDEYINLSQHGADLLDKVGQMTHHPDRPPGVSDEEYRLGADGCARSNLYSSNDIVTSVPAYMNDSDAGNIDRLGHRRWILNPAMAKTGFGSSQRFSAMYSFDNSRSEVPDFDFVAFPPPGYCPSDLFGADWAWHVSVNPAHYQLGKDARAEIYPVRGKDLKRAKSPLPLNYEHVDTGGFGIANAIIFRPKGLSLAGDTVYEVVVRGLHPVGDRPAEVSYYVSFYPSKSTGRR